MNRAWIGAMVAAGLAAGAAGGQEARVVGLDDCVASGLAHSAAAVNARRDQSISDTVVGQARAEALPQLTLKGAYTRLDEVQSFALGDQSVEAGTLDNYSATAEVNQLLYSGGRVRAALRAAQLSRAYAASAREATESQVARDVRQSFFAAVLAREAVGVRETSVAQLKAQADLAAEKFRSGTVSEFEMISAKVRLGNEEPLLIAARNALAVAIEDLRRVAGLGDGAVAVTGQLACVPVDAGLAKVRETAATRRADLRRMETTVALRREDMTAARSGTRPSLSARAAYNGANSYSFASFQGDWEWHWNAGLDLTWNIWDGNLTRSLVREKRLELAKTETSLDDLRRIVDLEATTAFLEMARAREAAAATAGTVTLAEKGLAIARSRYAAGLATYLEFTDSNLALSTARLAHLQALHDHMRAVAELQYACGLDDAEFQREMRGHEEQQ